MDTKMDTKVNTKEVIKDITREDTKDVSVAFKELVDQLQESSRLRRKDLYLLLSLNILPQDLEKAKEILLLVEKIWFSKKILKRILSYYSREQRKYLIVTAGLSPAESYIYTRILNLRQQGKEIKGGVYKRLLVELQQFYEIPVSKARRIIRQQANRVRMSLYYKHKKVSK